MAFIVVSCCAVADHRSLLAGSNCGLAAVLICSCAKFSGLLSATVVPNSKVFGRGESALDGTSQSWNVATVNRRRTLTRDRHVDGNDKRFQT